MNPFDLYGPQFLLFYAAFGAVLLGVVGAILRMREAHDAPPKMRVSDPYLLAYLRGGASETLRVAAASLTDRNLLKVDEELASADPHAARATTHPLERRLLEAVAREPQKVADLVGTSDARHVARALYEPELQRLGLVPDRAVWGARLGLAAGAAAILVGVAAMKIVVALSRGRTNIQYLMIEACVFVGLLWLPIRKLRTGRGDAALQDLQSLLSGLRGRAHKISASQQLLLAAAFGIADLAGGAVILSAIARAQRRAWSSSGCGSSCGSSCGGGCGGGCGGCGS